MPTLLRIDSSAAGEHSRTRQLTGEFAEAWRARGSDHEVVARDLHASPPPHLADAAQHWPQHLRGDAELTAEVAALQDEFIAELTSADALVIGAPMYNYTIPSTLKAWIDFVHVPSVTAPFDDPATQQPLAGRAAVIVSARGGTDEDGAFAHLFGPLSTLLGDGFGMAVRTVTTSRTLAEMIPELDATLAVQELAAASAEVTRIAREL